MIRLLINGILGKMGIALCRAAEESPEFEIAGGVDISRPYPFPYPVFSGFDAVDVPFDVIIDFSVPEALEDELAFVRSHPIPLVVGTTGLTDRHLRLLKSVSRYSPVFVSRNMSLGVNLQVSLVREAVSALGPGFDIEITEKHHRTKVDSPSGTALMLADAISDGSSVDYDYVFGRHEKNRRRTNHEIGFHSIRGGTIVGEHEVSFIGNDEIISVSHQAFSKRVFAEGALRAAAYLSSKPSGIYNMRDIVTEHTILSNVSILADQAVIHLESDSNDPGFVSSVFTAVSDQGVLVDMISCSAPSEGPLSLGFSVPDASLSAALKAVRKLKGISGVQMEGSLTKITAEGSGMALHKGIAARILSGLRNAEISISLITTSETKIEFCVPSSDTDAAVQTVRASIETA